MSPSHSVIGLVATVLFTAVLLPAAGAAQPAALSGGSVLLSGQASFDVERTSDSDESVTTFLLLPSVQYFVSPGLAVGGALQLAHFSFGGDSSTSYGIGPAISYYFVQGRDLHPFVRLSGQIARSTSDEASDTDVGVRGAAGVLFLLTESVGVDTALYYDRVEYGGDDYHVTNVGVAVGVSAFVF